MREKDDPIPAIVWYANKRANDCDTSEALSIIFVVLVLIVFFCLVFSGKFKEWDSSSQHNGCGCISNQR